jgi:hypothetical protein
MESRPCLPLDTSRRICSNASFAESSKVRKIQDAATNPRVPLPPGSFAACRGGKSSPLRIRSSVHSYKTTQR